MKNKRTLAYILALLQLMLLTASCSETPDEPETTTPADTSANTSSDTAAETEVDLMKLDTGLPERDLDGYDFKVLVKSVTAEHCHHDTVLSTEEFVGEGVNDAVHQREILLFDRYNFNTIPVVAPGADSGWNDRFRNSVLADDKDFDIGIGTTSPTSSVVLNGYTIPWNELSDVDLEKPWWNQSALDSLSVKGVTYYTVGDLTHESIAFTYCMFFNKELCENWGYTAESIYDMVEEGKWTLSKLYTMTNAIYEDTNGDGNYDYDDLYGFTANTLSGQAIFQQATDTMTCMKDENDMPVITTNTEKLATLVEQMYIIMFESQGTYAITKGYTTPTGFHDWWGMTSYKMLNHSTLFSTGLFYELYHEYTERDFEIGVLPLPKFNTAQERYQTAADYHAPFAVVPTTTNLDNAGFCSTALAAYGREIITPAYYETALKDRYADTERDSEMIELTMQGLVYDAYGVYRTSSILQNIIYDKNYNFASYWKKNERSLNRFMEAIAEAFEDYVE